jgi:FAD/FMN-containing dehydrogenase
MAEGEAAVAPLRAFGMPAADLVAPMPYLTLQTLFDAAYPPGLRDYWKSGYLTGLPDEAIAMMEEHFERAPSPHAVIFVEQHGGAERRVGPQDTAFPHRAAAYNLIITTAWEDPAEDEANIGWVRGVWQAMAPFTGDAVYVNYLGNAAHEGKDRVRDAYGAATYERLAALKRTYDPANLFRLNQNIAPA